MVEAWIFTIFCLLVTIPMAIAERRENERNKRYPKRYLQSRIQRI